MSSPLNVYNNNNMASSSKNKTFEWTYETTKELINHYEENECLYNNLDPDYKNRDKRQLAMANIAKNISDRSGRVCLVADVRKKINGLRSQYLAEKLKIIKCKSGSGGDYTPTVYWFPLLRFLDVSTDADASQSNLDCQSPQAGSDTQHSCEENERPPNQGKMKKLRKKKMLTAQDDDADGLIKEATATIKQMSEHFSGTPKNDPITAFCNFINSELQSILEASSTHHLNKAKRKIQHCLFEVWDEIDKSSISIPSSQESTATSIVSGTASSLIIKKKDLQQYNTHPQDSTADVTPQQTKMAGTASSLVIKRKDLKLYNSPLERKYVQRNIKQETPTSYVGMKRTNPVQQENTQKKIQSIPLQNIENTQPSDEHPFYLKNYDPYDPFK